VPFLKIELMFKFQLIWRTMWLYRLCVVGKKSLKIPKG